MRLSYVLLVATATTLLANGNALPAATSADQATAISSTWSSTGSSTGSSVLITSHEIGNGTGNEKRFLRSHRVQEDDDDSNEDDEDDSDEEEEEERNKGPGFFDSQRLEKMLNNRIYRSKWFNKWKNSGYTPGNVESEMGNKLYQKYRTWYYYGPGARRN
uniref:RxLR effector protein n=1 Tax=Phytophthora ramorum TaxID=164328 RepID=H3H4S8_PHYRM